MNMDTRSGWKFGVRKVITFLLAAFLFGSIVPTGAQEAVKQAAGPAGTIPTVTINVDDTDIVQVLNAFSQQSGQSIVIGPEVSGKVTARLKDIPWPEALDVIIGPHGYAYEQNGKTVVILPKDRVQSDTLLATEIFRMKFLDVSDVMTMVKDHLTPAGKVSVLGTQAEFGWDFDTGAGIRRGSVSGADKRRRPARDTEKVDFSKILVVSDTPRSVQKISDIIRNLDVLPPQILIKARFVEVNSGLLKDIGVEFGTGVGGASGEMKSVLRSRDNQVYGIGAQQVSGTAIPSAFAPAGSTVNPTAPFNTGMSMMFQTLSGTEFEILLHALEEDAKANTLSVPQILAVNNQEAAIIVGTKFPIIESQTTGQSATISTSLEYYENIGIQLNVVPQACGDGYIRMLVHPAVTDQTGIASARTTSGVGGDVPLTEYPILSTREADTQVIIQSGETIVIGGLIADREMKSEFRVPVLGRIPILGMLFRRDTTKREKVELVIFITASIKPPDESAGEAAEIFSKMAAAQKEPESGSKTKEMKQE